MLPCGTSAVSQYLSVKPIQPPSELNELTPACAELPNNFERKPGSWPSRFSKFTSYCAAPLNTPMGPVWFCHVDPSTDLVERLTSPIGRTDSGWPEALVTICWTVNR